MPRGTRPFFLPLFTNVLEGLFCELRFEGVLRSSQRMFLYLGGHPWNEENCTGARRLVPDPTNYVPRASRERRMPHRRTAELRRRAVL